MKLTLLALNLVVLSIVIAFVKEPQHVRAIDQPKRSLLYPFTSVFKNLVTMDTRLMIVCAVEFCSWWALFFWWTASSVWWKLVVYGGCIPVGDVDPTCLPTSAAFAAAVQGGKDYDSTGIFANLIQLVISFVLSILVLNGIVKRVKFVYSAGLAIGGIFLILLKFGPREIWFAWVTTLVMPIAIAVIQAFPFALVGSYNKDKDGSETGVQMGLLNLFICRKPLFAYS